MTNKEITNVKLMMPPELLRHDQWVQRPAGKNDHSWRDQRTWGKYQRNERDWFCLTPDLGIVVAITVIDDIPHQRWGLAKFPDGMKGIKLTKTLGIIIVSEACVVVPESEHWAPFISFQEIIDAFANSKAPRRRVAGNKLQEEIEGDLFGEFYND